MENDFVVVFILGPDQKKNRETFIAANFDNIREVFLCFLLFFFSKNWPPPCCSQCSAAGNSMLLNPEKAGGTNDPQQI